MMRNLETAPVLYLAAALAFLPAGCANREEDREALHTRCEVHLDELTVPVEDLRELTGLADPDDACELWLVEPIRTDVPEFQQVLRDRWGLRCADEVLGHPGELGGEPPDRETCDLIAWLDPMLLTSYRDGVLLCQPAAGTECPGSRAGVRTTCTVTDGSLHELGASASEGPQAGESVLSINTFDHDPDLVAVVWNATDPMRPWVSWLRVGDHGLLVPEEEIDLCDACTDVIGDGTPRGAFTSFQTAATPDGHVLVAGPCGARGLVELAPDGACQVHPLVADEVDETSYMEPFGVMPVDMGYVVLWSEGQRLRSSLLDEDGSVVSVNLIWVSDVTSSRDEPVGICFPDIEEGASCAVLWSMRESGSPDVPPFGDESSLEWNLHSLGETEEAWDGFHRVLGTGHSGKFSVSGEEWEACATPDGCEGLFVFRDPIYGLMARAWTAGAVSLDDEEAAPRPLTFDRRMIQLANDEETAGVAVAPAGRNVHAVSWVETAGIDAPLELRLDIVGSRASTMRLVSTKATVEGFGPLDPAFEAAVRSNRTMLARQLDSISEQPEVLLIGAVTEDGEAGCVLQIGLVSLGAVRELPDEGDWPAALSLSLVWPSWSVPVPGLCQPGCDGSAAWAEDRFVIALPDADGVRVITLAEGADGWALDEVPPLVSESSAEQARCTVALWASPESSDSERLVLVAADHLGSSEEGLRMWQGRREHGGWSFDEIATTEVADDLTRSPVFAVGLDPTPVLLWTRTPFEQWPQHDIGVAVVRDGRLEDREFPYRPVMDTRLAAAAGAPVPCDTSQPMEDDNLCAVIVIARPDPSEEDNGLGPQGGLVRTPTMYVTAGFVGRVQEDCPVCGMNQPIEGEETVGRRGLPLDLVTSDSGLISAISSMETGDWTPGEASLFRLAVTSDSSLWVSHALESRWLAGEEYQELRAPGFRLSASGDVIASTWSRRGRLGDDGYSIEYFFTLMTVAGDGVRPQSSVVMIDAGEGDADGRWSFEPFPGTALAMSLDSAVAILPDSAGYVVAWVRESRGVEPGVSAAHITCVESASEQHGR